MDCGLTIRSNLLLERGGYLYRDPMIAEDPNGDPSASTVSPDLNATGQDILAAPIPPSFSTSILRQSFLERKLEAGRSVAGIPVANLNIKVVDHWYRLGWYELFRRRFAILVYIHFPFEINPLT